MKLFLDNTKRRTTLRAAKENDNFSFFVAWTRTLTSESVFTLMHHLGYKTHILRLDTALLRNKNITSSGRYDCISISFRSPVRSATTLSARTTRFPITYKKPFDDFLNLWSVKWSSVYNYLKKLPKCFISL